MKLTITLLIALMISGCTVTEKQQVIDKISTQVKEVVVDNAKPETKIEDPTDNQQTEETQVVETPQGTIKDVDSVSALRWSSVGDPHQIVQCYFGYGHDSELFKMISALPVDFTCTLDNGGVSISCPTSDDTGRMASYPGDHMQARRAFVCLFDADNNLVDCQDFAESFHLDNRWKDKGAVKGLAVHCKQGNAVSRTALTEVK